MTCSSLTCATGCDHPAPHHPTPADLAAFRAALLPASIRATGAPLTAPAHGGAWEAERREGIGGRGVRHGHWYTAGDDHAEARREAAAMRSRAYERAFGSWQYACNVARDRGYDAGDWRPFIATEPDRAAHQAFVPR